MHKYSEHVPFYGMFISHPLFFLTGINITEGVFIFQNCFEVCASLDENCNSEGPDVKICVRFSETIIGKEKQTQLCSC